MSLSKELCLRSDSQNSDSFSDCLVNKFELKEDNYRRDSFCDRFCDDLCEEILQYLSLEDKLRIECVSKQFQRSVFKRQYELHINTRGPKVHKIHLDNKHRSVPRWYNYYSLQNPFRKHYNYYYIEDQSLDSFKALLKKCPNIASIELDGHNIYEVFRIIIENCNNLSEVIAMTYINDSNFEELQRKFGPKIKYLRTIRPLIDFNVFPNIEKIKAGYLIDDSIIPQLKLAKLKKLEVEFDQGQEDVLQTLIDYFPTLTHFNVFINSRDENAIYKPLKNISNLKHLIHLLFSINFAKNNNRFCDLLKQMGKYCKNLKSLNCGFNIHGKNSDTRQLLSQLQAFPALKRLNLLLLIVNNYGEDNIDVNQLFSFELFKGFENITHLSLRFDWTQTFERVDTQRD